MTTFTDREMEIMSKAWLCMAEAPKVNYEELAKLCGMSNPRSASNAWSGIRKKLDGLGNTDGIEPTPKATTKASKKRSTDGEDDSPAKKKKKKTSRAKTNIKAKKVKDEDDEDDEKIKPEPEDGSEPDFM